MSGRYCMVFHLHLTWNSHQSLFSYIENLKTVESYKKKKKKQKPLWAHFFSPVFSDRIVTYSITQKSYWFCLQKHSMCLKNLAGTADQMIISNIDYFMCVVLVYFI